MKDTGGVLTVKSRLGEDGQIQISVQTTGPGLPWVSRSDIRRVLYDETGRSGIGPWQSAGRSSNRMAGPDLGQIADGGRGAKRSHFSLQWLARRQTLPRMPHDSAFSRVVPRPSRRHLMHSPHCNLIMPSYFKTSE